eukprot:Sspe_Gene.66949::Locus_39540_Transcript_1_1_Confidence_1.000_Length_1494::g.66949::m.66949
MVLEQLVSIIERADIDNDDEAKETPCADACSDPPPEPSPPATPPWHHPHRSPSLSPPPSTPDVKHLQHETPTGPPARSATGSVPTTPETAARADPPQHHHAHPHPVYVLPETTSGLYTPMRGEPPRITSHKLQILAEELDASREEATKLRDQIAHLEMALEQQKRETALKANLLVQADHQLDAKQSELVQLLSVHKDMRLKVMQVLQHCRDSLPADASPPLESLKAELDKELAASALAKEEVESWFACALQAKDESSQSRLEAITLHLQQTGYQLEQQLLDLRATCNRLEHEKGSAEIALRSHLVLAQEAQLEGVGSEADQQQIASLQGKVDKLSSDLSEKHSLIKAMNTEKAELRDRLEEALSKIEELKQLPRHQVDQSAFFQHLSEKGKVGQKLTRVASLMDSMAWKVGRFFDGNAVIRVAAIFYLALLHVWVFFVIAGSVHSLPHAAGNVHEHTIHFHT